MRHSFLYFVGTHFRIFVRKFLVHLRTVHASPQKLARPLCYNPTRVLWFGSSGSLNLLCCACSGSDAGQDGPSIDHFDFGSIIPQLPFLEELHLTYG